MSENTSRIEGVSTAEAPRPGGSYSQGITANGLLFIAGQVPVDPGSGAVPEEFDRQVRQTLDNLAAVARAAGTSLARAVRVGVYLADLERFKEMDAIYKQYFEEPPPARTTVGVSLLGFQVEMDAIVAGVPIPDQQGPDQQGPGQQGPGQQGAG